MRSVNKRRRAVLQLLTSLISNNPLTVPMNIELRCACVRLVCLTPGRKCFYDPGSKQTDTPTRSETRARQLMGMPAGDSIQGLRDRAILKFYFYTDARIATGCKLKVSDFHQDGDEATLRFHIKGGHVKTKGIHFSAAESIAEYIKAAGIESGPLFRPRLSAYGDALASRRMTERSMHRVLMSYLERLPGAMQEKELPSGEKIQECIYSPHSLRATTATLLLDSSVAIESVQDLLDHKHITTTQIYDKRRRSVRDFASHKVPI